MVRRYGDLVEVREVGPTRAGEQADPGAPGSFLWRGRVYVVRSVLGHWQERRAWWTTAAARAVHGEPTAGDPVPGSDRCAVLGAEREVWRVEASPGRSFGAGVYDLCRDPAEPPAGASDSWRLLRVAD